MTKNYMMQIDLKYDGPEGIVTYHHYLPSNSEHLKKSDNELVKHLFLTTDPVSQSYKQKSKLISINKINEKNDI